MTAECEKVKQDRENRRQRLGPAVEPKEITRAHRIYRCIPDNHIDREADKPRPAAFDQAGMSVFVEGPGFAQVNWTEILSKKKDWKAVAFIDASEFLDKNDQYKFELLHDPYADEKGNQHDNHALIVCKKNATKCTNMQKACTWEISPEQISSYQQDVEHNLSPLESELRTQQISLRAYEIWMSRGCTHGHDLQDWFDAEGRLDA